jgi:two-component system response regulator FixJ
MTRARPRIAVIDDDDGVRFAVIDLLRAADFAARAFASAEAFLARPPAERFDCLIVDVNLPGMTGVALLNALGGLGPPPPAVLITGRHDPATLDLLGRAGPVPRLRKPFGDAELFDALRLAMGPVRPPSP